MKEKYEVGHLIYDPTIYDGLNSDLSDLDFYMKWLPRDKNAHILELCCGTGRLTIPIAERGYRNITGVDITTSMLNEAKVKAQKANVNVNFIEADIRHLELAQTYDFIFIPFNSIHHLYKNEDLFNVFDSIRKYLKKDGYFLFDCYNPDIRYIVEGEKHLKQIAEFQTSDNREILIKQQMHYEYDTQINRIEWHYFINGEFDSIQRLDMRMYFPQELDSYLLLNNFKIVDKFGDFEEFKFNESSNKQIYVCKKA